MNIEKLVKCESDLKRKIFKSISLLEEIRQSIITSAVIGQLNIQKSSRNVDHYSDKIEKLMDIKGADT
jgi:hypothetical protein